MKIGVLTSSRSDYGIYLPLLKKLKFDRRFQLEVIVFGPGDAQDGELLSTPKFLSQVRLPLTLPLSPPADLDRLGQVAF